MQFFQRWRGAYLAHEVMTKSKTSKLFSAGTVIERVGCKTSIKFPFQSEFVKSLTAVKRGLLHYRYLVYPVYILTRKATLAYIFFPDGAQCVRSKL